MPEDEAPRAAPPTTPHPRVLPLALFLLLAGAIVAAVALSFVANARDLRRHVERELSEIAALKVEEIEHWRAEQTSDVSSIAAEPALVRAIHEARSPAEEERLQRMMSERLRALRPHSEFTGLALVGSSGETRSAAGDVASVLDDPEVRSLVRRAVDERRTFLSDVHEHQGGDRPHIAFATPVKAGAGEERWAIVGRLDPRVTLFPMIQSWPSPSATAETLLVRGVGDGALLVSERRHREGQPPGPAVLSRRDAPAVRAALGERGVVEGIDYRGTPVLAAIHPVPDSPWVLVAKMDTSEALASLVALRRWTVVVALALVFAAGTGAAFWWSVEKTRFERARAEAESGRRELARRLERLTRYALDLILITDGDLHMVEANERAVSALGYSHDELLRMRASDLCDPSASPDFDAHVREAAEHGSKMFETLYRRKDGTSFPVEVSLQCDEHDGRRHFQAIVRDIARRKQAEEALRASEEKFRAAFEFASLGIVLVAPDGSIVETNRAFRQMLGFGDEPMRGIGISSLMASRPGAEKDDLLRRLRAGEIDRVEAPRLYRRRDGSVVETFVRITALRDGSGAVVFALGVVEDVSERKRLQAQLLLADRMASVGTLAAGVAHEINNPLAFILANVEFALAELTRLRVADEELVRALADARDGAGRVRDIVRDLKAFSRPDENERAAVDLRAVVRSAIALASNEIRHRARLVVECGDVPPVLAGENRLAQVIVNLLVNAGQAIPEGHAERNAVRVTTSTAPDGRAVIEVADTGAGIPHEMLPRIFDPFFTTKPVGVGTGLGLSICHGIVTSLGGEISAESEPGRGSRFRVVLPAAAPAVPQRTQERAETPTRRGRILVVDDEPLVGRAVSRVLSPAHDVVVRTSGKDALDVVARTSFDVALLDLMMPDMTGMELHDRLAAVAPGLASRTIFLTGGAFTATAREFLDRVPNPRIEKPFEPAALREMVARLIAFPADGDGGTPAPPP